MKFLLKAGLTAVLTLPLCLAKNSLAQPTDTQTVLHIDAGKVMGKVSPRLYGMMTEEINYSYEGGLYGELIRNRSFKANPTNPVYWKAVGGARISLDTNQPLNTALGTSLKMELGSATAEGRSGFENQGYWGIPVRPHTTYRASFYARANEFFGPLRISLESADGKTLFASKKISRLTKEWKEYEATLTTKDVPTSKQTRLVVSIDSPKDASRNSGIVWFQQVSLFGPTYNKRDNGNRPDLMQLMADMKPKFLRFPGGNYLEGDIFSERFNWKETIGDIATRPGHRSPWNYWSTDGLGLMEFLQWCEDLKMEPVLAVFAGYALRHDFVQAGSPMEPYVQEALDEIEYVSGDIHTKWGAQRARDGHPKPFKLSYVEVGNEDWFDRSGSYDGRFAQLYDAIKAKHPEIQIISSIGFEHATSQWVHSRTPDLVDVHYYRSQEEMEAHALDYDKYSRTNKSKIFVGEWATRVGSPTPNMAGALGDAAWMTGMERNSDIVVMSCYAPLFVNVSDLRPHQSMQWATDLIGYDALNSYGSPAYYAQKMFSTLHGDEILATTSENIPTVEWQPPARKRNGVEQPRPPKQTIRKLFFDATRDSKNGSITLKIVNSLGVPKSVRIEISGARSVLKEGKAVVLKAESPSDTNSIDQAEKITPHEETISGAGSAFTREVPPYSVTVLELKTR